MLTTFIRQSASKRKLQTLNYLVDGTLITTVFNMNFFLFMLSVGGLCYGLESNHHYKYKYSAYFKSGIPDDGNEEVGMAMKAIIDVFVEDNDGIAIFKLSDVSTFNFNEDLGEVDFTDKRFHHLEDEDLSRIFEQPFRVNLRDSDPYAIEYAATEHRWVSNVRKGIASMLKNEILKGNFVTQVKDSIPSLFHQGHLVNNFYVDEETIFGICKAKYNIHQIPNTMFTGSNDLTPTRQDGAKKDLWHVTRTIDFDKCTEIVALHVHTTNNRRHKHKKLKFTRTSVSSYVLRGSPGHFDLYSVLTEGATTYPLSLFNENEVAQSTVRQKLVLIDEGPFEVLPELGANLKRSATWMHEVWSPFQRPKEGKPHSWIVYSNENKPHAAFEMFGTKDLSDDQIALAKTKIIEIIQKSSQMLADLHQETENFPPEAISESLQIASYFFRFLKKKDHLKIFDHIFERNVGIEKQLVINAAAATGSYNGMEAIMDYVEEDKIGPTYLFTTLLTMTRNSYGTLNVSRLMDYLLRSEEPSEYLLNFAHYLSEYCIHKVHNYIPIAGEAECDSSIINTRFIPYLKEIIYNEELTWERGYAVKVLTLLRSGFTFEIVSPLIDGRMKSSVALKAMAVRALENWSIYPEMTMKTPIIDLLTDVYSDVSQDLHVRTAALLAIISWEPNTKFWYNLALKTWNDPSNEFASFASSLIKTYAEDNLPSLEKQKERAAFALKFAKPPSKSSSSYNFEFYKAFFNKQEKFSLFLSMVSKRRKTEISEMIFNILTNIEQLSLFKIEKYHLYGESVTKFNETVQKDYSNIPQAEELLGKLYNEMHFEELPITNFQKYETFYEILNDVFVSLNSLRQLNYIIHDSSHPVKYHVSQYLNLMDKSDYHPNELGLPLFTYSTLPAVFCTTHEQLPPTPGFDYGDELQLRFSSVYASGISVFLPWSSQYSTAMTRVNLELKIPIGVKNKRIVGTEGPLRASKTSFEFPYKKKFPLFHLSSTPMTIIYDTVQILENGVPNFEVIKKSNVKEKLISEVNPHTGIKYDLVMRTDTPTSFGLRDFLQFPEISFRVWSLDFYLDLKESETKELLVTHSRGRLLNSDEYEGGDFDHNSNESRKEKSEISFHDNFKERSRKITNLMKTSKRTNYIRYQEYKLDFIGKFARHIEFFNAAEMIEGPHLHYYRFETVGFTSAGPNQQQDILKSVCFNLHSSHYSGFDKQYYDSSSVLPKHEINELECEVLRGCTENIFTAKVVYNYSEENSDKTKEYCKTNYGEEKCYVEDYNLLFSDDIRVTIHNGNNNISIQRFLEFFSAKGFDFWISEPNPQFNLRRNPYHGHWDLYLNKESENILLTTFSDNFLIKSFLNYPSQFSSFGIPFFKETVQKCTLKTTSVETFDGLKFNYELSNCWTLVSETEGRVFLIRKPQGESSIPDFKYFKFDKGTVIDFSNNELKINGSIINSSDTVISYSIYKEGNTYLIFDKYGDINIIVSKNKIEYYENTKHLKLNGICGSDYGKAIPELIGPKKCVYDDAQMFTASWTGQSENCNSAVLKEYRKEVEDYQTKCKPYDGQPIESVVNPRCLFLGWKILTLSDHSYCISAIPLPFCSSHCDIKKIKTVEMAYKCWPKEKAPLRLKTSIEKKDDVITDPISAEPYFYEFSSTEMAKICKQF